MAQLKRIAIVTGSNKGIGFEIVKELCKRNDLIVYLTARDINRGNEAVSVLKKSGLEPQFHQLDVENIESVNDFANHIKTKYGGLDILVNNAAILLKKNKNEPTHIQAQQSFDINYFGLINVCNAFFPLLKPHSRVVNVSSELGALSNIKNNELKQKLSSEHATINDVTEIMNKYLEATKQGPKKVAELGFPTHEYETYTMTKVGVCAITRIQQGMFDNDPSRPDVVVNSITPGYCKTDMTGNNGYYTAEEGAKVAIQAALLEPNITSPKGQFLTKTGPKDWVTIVY